MGNKISLENAVVNVLLGIGGEVYVVAMEKEKLKTVETLVKLSTHTIAPTGVYEEQLAEFLGFKEHQEKLDSIKRKQRSEGAGNNGQE